MQASIYDCGTVSLSGVLRPEEPRPLTADWRRGRNERYFKWHRYWHI